MKIKTLAILVAFTISSTACALADESKAATICSGATTLNNGSVVSLGQPFVGQMSSGGGGITMQIGLLASFTHSSPVAPVQLNTPTFQGADGAFGFTFLGQSGQTYVVEASTNLLHWSPIWTNLGSGSIIGFSDRDAVLYSQRFYRLLAR